MATYDPFRDLDRLATSFFDVRRGPEILKLKAVLKAASR